MAARSMVEQVEDPDAAPDWTPEMRTNLHVGPLAERLEAVLHDFGAQLYRPDSPLPLTPASGQPGRAGVDVEFALALRRTLALMSRLVEDEDTGPHERTGPDKYSVAEIGPGFGWGVGDSASAPGSTPTWRGARAAAAAAATAARAVSSSASASNWRGTVPAPPTWPVALASPSSAGATRMSVPSWSDVLVSPRSAPSAQVRSWPPTPSTYASLASRADSEGWCEPEAAEERAPEAHELGELSELGELGGLGGLSDQQELDKQPELHELWQLQSQPQPQLSEWVLAAGLVNQVNLLVPVQAKAKVKVAAAMGSMGSQGSLGSSSRRNSSTGFSAMNSSGNKASAFDSVGTPGADVTSDTMAKDWNEAQSTLADEIRKVKRESNDGYGIVPCANNFTRNRHCPEACDPALPTSARANVLLVRAVFRGGRVGLFQVEDKVPAAGALSELLKRRQREQLSPLVFVMSMDGGEDAAEITWVCPTQLTPGFPEAPFQHVLRVATALDRSMLDLREEQERKVLDFVDGELARRDCALAGVAHFDRCELQLDGARMLLFGRFTKKVDWNAFNKRVYNFCSRVLSLRPRIWVQRKMVSK